MAKKKTDIWGTDDLYSGSSGATTNDDDGGPSWDDIDDVNYAGGAAGVEADLGLRSDTLGREQDAYTDSQRAQYDTNTGVWRDWWAQQNSANQSQWNANRDASLTGYQSRLNTNSALRNSAAGMATGAQIASAQGYLSPARDIARQWSEQGAWDQNTENNLISQRRMAAGNIGRQTTADIANSAAQRGGRMSPLAMAAMGLKTNFAQADAGGRAYQDIATAEAANRMQGLQQYGYLSGSMADYASRPTQENALSLLQDEDMPTFDTGPEVEDYREFDAYDTTGLGDIYDDVRNREWWSDENNDRWADDFGDDSTSGSSGNGGAVAWNKKRSYL